MGSLCEFLFFWQALFVHGKPIFSGRQVKKKCKQIPVRKQWELNAPAKVCHQAYTTGPPLCTTIPVLRDHVQTERRKIF